MRALIVVDVQNDFVTGGALAVPGGEAVVPVINRLIPHFAHVVATLDWHPPHHRSFASQHPGCRVGETIDLNGLQQILWPDHCVADTPGADFVPGLNSAAFQAVFRKGTDREIDSYSGFFDNGRRKSTGLGEYLRQQAATEVFIAGLTTDYCVKFSALDARSLGFETWVVLDATRAVDIQPGDGEAAVAEMRAAGVRTVHSDALLAGAV